MSLDVYSPSSLYLDTPDEGLTADLIEAYFSSLWDELYIASAALDRVLPDPALQRTLLQKAVAATDRAAKQARDVVSAGEIVREAVDEEEQELESTVAESSTAGNAAIGAGAATGTGTGSLGGTGHDERTKRLLALRAVALHRLALLETYVVLAEDASWLDSATVDASSGAGAASDAAQVGGNANSDEEEEDDPWADDDFGGDALEPESQPPTADIPTPTSPIAPSTPPPPIMLPAFLTSSLLESALILTSALRFTAVSTLLTRHPSTLLPRRFEILDAIPPFVHPQEYAVLLPRVDWSTGREVLPVPLPTTSTLEDGEELERELDLVQTEEGIKVYGPTLEESYTDFFGSSFVSDILLPHPSSTLAPLPAEEVTAWYTRRITYVDGQAGLTDVALEIVQHGASLGVPGLDEVGEELSLLARLVYDSPGAGSTLPSSSSFPSSSSTSSTSTSSGSKMRTAPPPQYTLNQWRSLSPQSIIHAYLAHCTPGTLAADIRRLVMPYLFVLEARAERAGTPDEGLAGRLIRGYILGSPDSNASNTSHTAALDLELCAAIFEASKPVAPLSQRIIRDDEELARVALARLYGASAAEVGAVESTGVDVKGNAKAWATMSRIFECLPDWPSTTPSDSNSAATEDEGDADAALASFIQPTTTRSTPPPFELFTYFAPLPARALSRALDVLDVHLECGEIMARWGVPVSLAWFLGSSGDVREQRAWATRMVRRTLSSSSSLNETERGGGVEGESKRYSELLGDMIKLVGPSGEKARGAFRLLGRQEVTKVFFSGLLTAGKFDLAKKFLTNPSVRRLNAKTTEELCLAASREFYDNASSGNLHVGDMKLAYDCLTVPSNQTESLRAERAFIEATSRICSFNTTSRPGTPITPLEIRLVKDRLSLVSRVLSESEDAYKYPDIILELVHKLGFKKSDKASEVKVRAMLADSALQSEDFDRAAEMVEKMVALLGKVRLPLPASESSGSAASAIASPQLNGAVNGNGVHAAATTSAPPPVSMEEAIEVCWHSCFQLGRQGEFHDTKRKLKLLGHALQLCPPENTLDILAVWRRLETEDIEAKKELKKERTRRVQGGAAGSSSKHSSTTGGRLGLAGSLSGRSASLFSGNLSDYAPSSEHLLHQGADAAALAKQTLSRVAANFPFDLRPLRGATRLATPGHDSDGDASSTHSGGVARSLTPDVSSHARHALSRGMGWLIGDDA